MDITMVVGLLAALMSCSMALPQMVDTYKSRDSSRICRGTWIVVLLNGILWMIYAILTSAYAAGIPSLVNIPLATYLLYKSRGQISNIYR